MFEGGEEKGLIKQSDIGECFNRIEVKFHSTDLLLFSLFIVRYRLDSSDESV